MRLFRALVVVTVLALGAASAVAFVWYRQPLPLPASPFEFEVRPGATLAHPYALIALARVKGVDRTIKAGSYEVGEGIMLPQLLAKLTQGDVTQSSLTIVEGTTFADLMRSLGDSGQITHTLADLPDTELLARLGIAEKSPEGLFFPDTYFFANGSSDAALLKRAHRALAERLRIGWDRRAADLPLATPYEALILASIVEKETGYSTDRPLIASVLVNRLKRGMRLQVDPTVIYGIGDKFDGNLRKRDLEADSAYNTYVRDGLPPTPIALPSQASLDAVLNPPPTSYLYFVSRGDGTSEFSSTLADHNRAVSKYQKGGR